MRKWDTIYYLEELGSDCRTSVEHTPRDKEVVGSNPAGCWAFFSLLFRFPFSVSLSLSISGVSLIRSLIKVHHY